MVDFFDRLDVPSLDRLGDTAFPLRPAGAYATAGLTQSPVPVVYNGNGTQTQDALSAILSPNPMDAFRYGKKLGTDAGNSLVETSGLGGLVNNALLGAAAIALLAVGAYVLLRGD